MYKSVQRGMWLILLFSCVGASWFSYQVFLVPQGKLFTPQWRNAEWIQVRDGLGPTAYFRHVESIDSPTDTAFITIAANQVFSLYVNGSLVGSNALDFAQGNFPQAYRYDVASLLVMGRNVLAARVYNADQQPPSLRINFGLMRGNTLLYSGSGEDWLATAQSSQVYPRYLSDTHAWTTREFTTQLWSPARRNERITLSPALKVNPLLYEHSLTTHWISGGSKHDAYFVRRVVVPAKSSEVWLCLASTGSATIFINGRLLISWNGRAPAPPEDLSDYITDDAWRYYRVGFPLGIYDVTPYLHEGNNTIAVHVLATGVNSPQLGMDNLSAALSLDMLINIADSHPLWLNQGDDWHVSAQAVNGWTEGNGVVFKWLAPISVGRPGNSKLFYLPEQVTARNVQYLPLEELCLTSLATCTVIIVVWLLSALILRVCVQQPYRIRLAMISLAYLPALAAEALLIVLAREPQMPRPFPYTFFWFWLLIALVLVSDLLLMIVLRLTYQSMKSAHSAPGSFPFLLTLTLRGQVAFLHLSTIIQTRWQRLTKSGRPSPVIRPLLEYTLLLPVLLFAIPMIFYHLGYEPYWQDELSSYYAAQGVLTHGLPFFPSGFLYEKAELYSYLLAGWILLFGSGGARAISALEYLASILLLYYVGRYFFGRRVAGLATVMLAFSPLTLLWGRQVRMYEQAQLLVLLVLYLFYRALMEPQRRRWLYLGMLALLATYLSHEETFVILPALLLCVLVFSRNTAQSLPAVCYVKRWWIVAFFCGAVIALQLALTHLTHPPVLGSDSSQRPFIQLTTDNIGFYLNLLFFPWTLSKGTLPWIPLSSLLACSGCLWACHDRQRPIQYCALFLVLSCLILVFTFTMQADRYFYPLLSIYYLVGAYGFVRMITAIHRYSAALLALGGAQDNSYKLGLFYLRPILALAALLSALSVLIAPVLPLANYNLLISRITGFSYHRHYVDYDVVGDYVQRHWQAGDAVLAIAPDFCVFYYVGRADYFLSIDRALYLLERKGHIIDTSIGALAVLNQRDLEAVVSTHARIWIISDAGVYRAQALKRFIIPADFHIVYEGYSSVVYLRGG